MNTKQRIAIALTPVVLIGAAFAGSGADPGLSGRERRDILQAVATIKSAIAGVRIGALLHEMSPSLGLTCSGTNYSFKTVTHFLFDTHSFLYMGLFDSAGLARACSGEYPDISEQEFLKTAENSVDIATVGRDWVEVTIPSHNATHPPRVWSLHREGRAWKLADGSLTVGRCTCG